MPLPEDEPRECVSRAALVMQHRFFGVLRSPRTMSCEVMCLGQGFLNIGQLAVLSRHSATLYTFAGCCIAQGMEVQSRRYWRSQPTAGHAKKKPAV